MARTGHPNFVYDMESPWRIGAHRWSLTGNHSGSSFDATDAETFMTGTASPFALSFGPFISPVGTTVVRAAYYDGSTSTPVWEATYTTEDPAPTPLVPTGLAFSSHTGQLPLETCVILEAQAGLSSRTKPVYLRKYIHAVPIGTIETVGSEINFTFDGGSVHTAAAHAMGDGSWFGTRVYISPTGRQPLTDAWTPLVAPGNHQMPRGRKRKITTSGSSSSLLSEIEGLAAAAAAKLAAEAAAAAGAL
jgi:hypothetical protein